MTLRYLQDKGKSEPVTVIRNSTFEIEPNKQFNLYGGIEYLNLVFKLKYKDYISIENTKDAIAEEIYDALIHFHKDVQQRITSVLIQPVIEQYIDWDAVYPITKSETIEMIEKEKSMLLDVSTGKLKFTTYGVEDDYRLLHQKIVSIANKAGFDYPVKTNSLAEWWREIKDKKHHYSDRREYISGLFEPLLNTLRSSEESNSSDVIKEIVATQEKVESISRQSYERFESAKRQFYNMEIDERARKDAVRSCFDAMEALVKELGDDKDIKEATKNLTGAKDNDGFEIWGPSEIVKDGHNLFNQLHRLYPDVRHGTQDALASTMTMEEAKYYVERITAFMNYMVSKAKKIGKM